MPFNQNQPDLIIFLSRNRIHLDLPSGGEYARSTFDVEHILGDQLSQSMDKVLTDNPHLIRHLPCVEMVTLDSPHVALPGYYQDEAVSIASRYLRKRAGDIFSMDHTSDGSIFCYTLPGNAIRTMKEYYSNVEVTHFTSLLWHFLKSEGQESQTTYYTLIHNTLTILSARDGKLVFSKSFHVTCEDDMYYYAVACDQMIRSGNNEWLIAGKEEEQFEFPSGNLLRIDRQRIIPSLAELIAAYKPCGS